jgi:ParB/RepB/Spo0J family partition protein
MDAPKRKSLGRGFGALIPQAPQPKAIDRTLPLDDIAPNPWQPRILFDEAKIQEMAESIGEHGIIEPLVVRPRGGGYELIAGERRLRAARLAGLESVPVAIREMSDRDVLEVTLIENLQREDLSPLEEAEALAGLIERHGYGHQEVADLLGKSRPYVSNTLALVRLPAQVKAELHRAGHGVSRELLTAIARETDPDTALALWRRLQQETPSVREFRVGQGGRARERPALRELLLAIRRVNRALRRLLAEGDVPSPDTPHLRRVLRRTERLVQRQLAALAR